MKPAQETGVDCSQVAERITELLDGSAPEELVDHLSDCDECRDVRHEAMRAAEQTAQAGADYVLPEDFEDDLLEAAEKRSVKPAPDGKAGAADDAPTDGRWQAAIGKASDGLRSVARSARKRPLAYGLVGVGALAAGAALIATTSSRPTSWDLPLSIGSWKGEVAHVTSGAGSDGLRVCQGGPNDCRSAGVGTRLSAGDEIVTDDTTRARLKLQDGTELVLDRGTRFSLQDSGARHARLSSGAIVADVAHQTANRARFEVAAGRVEVLGTKFALRADGDHASVEVSRGRVRLVDGQDREVIVAAGEAGRLQTGLAPHVSATSALGEALAWSEIDNSEREEGGGLRGLGQLVAKKPGAEQELKDAVTLTSHSVKVRIAGTMARTEIDEVFTNHTGDVLEGIYRFPIPPDAKIERLALEVDGRLIEGAFADRERAAAIWRGAIVNSNPQAKRHITDDIVWVPGPWEDPALLEWQRGGRFELRIYPIPARGARRVVLAYTQLIQPTGDTRRYVYPLAHDPGGSTRVDKCDYDVQVRGHDAAFGVQAHGYAMTRGQSGDGAESFAYSATGCTPNGDLMVEYALPNRHSEVTAWTYRGSGDTLDVTSPTPRATSPSPSNDRDAYVAIALRPRLPQARDGEEKTFALVVDSSRSMYGESFRRATRIASRIARELDPLHRVTVLACDVECRAMPDGLREPGAEAGRDVRLFLESIEPEGASDVTAAIRFAAGAAGDKSRSLRIVYIGDGTPTVGPVRPGSVAQAVRSSLPSGAGTVTAVAIGGDSDADTLGALARGGGGVVVPYVPGETVAAAAYGVIAATHGASLRDVTVELPEGLGDVAPKQVDSIPAGSESIIVARMNRAEIDGSIVLRGQLGKERFEQRYPIRLSSSSAKGNAFVPRLFAAVRIADLEQAGDAEAKQEAIRLSSRFNVASRFTSLLVLESEAMFRAFGLDNARSAPVWTGEDQADSTDSDSELAMDDEQSGDEGRGVVRSLPRPASIGKSGGNLGYDSYSGGPAGNSAPAQRAASKPKASTRLSEEAPAAAAPSPPPAPTAMADPAPKDEAKKRWDRDVLEMERPRPLPTPRPRSLIPMRRIWERTGTVHAQKLVPNAWSMNGVDAAARELDLNPNRREAVKKLYTLHALSGELGRASEVAERWADKDPLDADALTARADLAARTGDRERAIRMLGSVLDVRPSDTKAQQRLARLQRWAGRPALGCRYSVAIAELRQKEAKLVADAVRCARDTGESALADLLLSAADTATRNAVAPLLGTAPDDAKLSGDVRLEATWTTGQDVDVALLDKDGNRISWLGAPTRAVITSRDVTSTRNETLGLRGAAAGEYVIEVVRSKGTGPVRGTLLVVVGDSRRTLDFQFDGARTTVGVLEVKMRQKLVPL